MRSVKLMLLGIAFILFGMACFMTAEAANWGIYEIPGALCPLFGICLSIYGAWKKED